MIRIVIFLLMLNVLYAQMTPQNALKKLKEGNQRYIDDHSKHPNRGQERRELVYSTQTPYAIILSCSDSRVSPEIVFDQGIGDLFVVRNAGNVIDPVALESIEFAALHLGSSIIVVMGHENCGAVNAVVKGQTKDIEAIARVIQPSVDEAKKQGDQNLLYNAITDNAKNMKNQLSRTHNLKSLIERKQIQIVPAYYDLGSGKVYFLEN